MIASLANFFVSAAVASVAHAAGIRAAPAGGLADVFPHFSKAGLSRSVSGRLNLLGRLHPGFTPFARSLHLGFDHQVRTMTETILCHEHLSDADTPDLVVWLARRRARLRSLLNIASWLEPAEEELTELTMLFEVFLSLDGLDFVTPALESWGRRLEREARARPSPEMVAQARREGRALADVARARGYAK